MPQTLLPASGSAPLLPIAVCLMVGIAVGSSLHLPFAPVWLLVVCLPLFVVARRPLLQSIIIYVCSTLLGMTLSEWQHEEPLEGKTLEAVVMSEPAERPKTMGMMLLVPSTGESVRCYLKKDHDSRSLKLGDAVVVRLSHKMGGEGKGRRQAMYYVKSGDWQLGGTARKQMSRVERSRLFFLKQRHRLLQRYQALEGSDDVYGILAAMTLGDKSSLTKETQEIYNISGASHVLALSGLHLGIVYMLLTWLMLGRPHFMFSQVVIVSALWAFALLTGLSPSVTRSATMFSIYAIFAPRSRGRASINVLAFAAIVMLIAEPRMLFEVGFQMSFSAVLAILLFMPLFEKLWQPRHRLTQWLWGTISMTVAAQLGTTPIVIYYFGRFSTWFILTNLIVIPAASIIILMSLPAIVFPPLGKMLVWTVEALNHSLSAIASLPYSSIDGIRISGIQVALIYVLIVTLYLMARVLTPYISKKMP